MAEPQSDLAIRGESVQRVYNFFTNQKFIINRRYQRKLVWTIEEKAAFIDSIRKEFPVPLLLLAEVASGNGTDFEVIDGMQRLNAIISFIEGEFSVNDEYFDLDTMADTKLRLDEGVLTQHEPKMPRAVCAEIASYTLPLSVYRLDASSKIDEIFRRINSNGRTLSRQELRQAGAIGNFAQLVRTISAKIRGDVSASDILALNAMKNISITNRDLQYGIKVDDIFWVQQNILTRENVRESRDEELVADLLAYMALTEKPSTSSDILDEYFGVYRTDGTRPRFDDIELAVQKLTPEVLTAQFIRVHETIRLVMSQTNKAFNTLMFEDAGVRVPRYYQAVFLAFYELMFKKNQEISDIARLVSLLDGIGKKFVDVGGGGGRWSGSERQNNVNSVSGVIAPAFRDRDNNDPATYSWATEFENILVQSFTEQNLYDFKQGLHDLDKSGKLNEDLFHKIIKTLLAMANHGPGAVGYVLLGVCESEQMARQHEQIYGTKAQKYNRFYVTGIEDEAVKFNKDLDSYFQQISQKIANEPIPQEAKDYIGRNIKLIKYFNKAVVVFKITAGSEPYDYNKTYYVRKAANLDVIPFEEYGGLFKRFLTSG